MVATTQKKKQKTKKKQILLTKFSISDFKSPLQTEDENRLNSLTNPRGKTTSPTITIDSPRDIPTQAPNTPTSLDFSTAVPNWSHGRGHRATALV